MCVCAVVQEDMSVAEAVSSLPTDTKQPVLFALQGQYYIKVDSNAVPVVSASCFFDAVEFLLWLHYVFNLMFEYKLKPTFSFIEKILKLPVSIGRSSALTDLSRSIQI